MYLELLQVWKFQRHS